MPRKTNIDPDVREVLDMLDEKFCTLGADKASQLWNILTALRGPDELGLLPYDAKRYSTSIIRAKAFPKLAKMHFRVPAKFETEARKIRYDLIEAASRHFRSHILRAASALGLNVPKGFA